MSRARFLTAASLSSGAGGRNGALADVEVTSCERHRVRVDPSKSLTGRAPRRAAMNLSALIAPGAALSRHASPDISPACKPAAIVCAAAVSPHLHYTRITRHWVEAI